MAHRIYRSVSILGLVVLGVLPASGSAHPNALRGWNAVEVPTGGFSIELPANWVYATSAMPSAFLRLNRALKRSPPQAMRLIAADTSPGVDVAYMEVDVERPVGTTTLEALARQSEA